MNRGLANQNQKQSATSAVFATSTRVMMIAAFALVAGIPAIAQNSELQAKLAAVKQAVAENQQSLRQYQWTETTQPTLKGEPKPESQKLCQYGSYGQVEKTSIGAPPPPPSGGRLKQRVVANKKEEMADYMGGVKELLSAYVPPDPQKMDQAFQAGKASLNPMGGIVDLVFRDYAVPGDQMTLRFESTTKKIVSLSVNTYMGDAKDAVTLQVQMASLPDGTNHVQQTILNASAKQLVVTTTNSNYQRLAGR
jgi:hypothetical protein